MVAKAGFGDTIPRPSRDPKPPGMETQDSINLSKIQSYTGMKLSLEAGSPRK